MRFRTFFIIFSIFFVSFSSIGGKKKCELAFLLLPEKVLENPVQDISKYSALTKKAYLKALHNRKLAEAPYSGFHVGASLLISYFKGNKRYDEIFYGFNIENVAFNPKINLIV